MSIGGALSPREAIFAAVSADFFEGVRRTMRAVSDELGAEDLKIHRRGELLQWVASLRELAQSMLDVPEPSLLTRHARLAHHPSRRWNHAAARKARGFPEASIFADMTH